MKPPAFQFYPDDFISGTFAFTDEEVGQYVRMLCYQWTHGSAIESDYLSIVKSRKLSARVLQKFTRGRDGKLRNRRLEAERKKQKEFRIKKKQAGEKGANKRWHNHDSAMPLPLANDSSPSSISDLRSVDVLNAQPQLRRPSLKEVLAVCEVRGYPKDEGERFWNHFESSGWIDRNGNRIQVWESKLANWITDDRARTGELRHNGKQPAESKQRHEDIPLKKL